MEVWLRSNRRALLLGTIAPLLLLVVGVALCFGAANQPVRIFAALLVVLGGGLLILLGRQMRQPRLAYRDGVLLAYLRFGQPIRLPVQIAECFLLGSGPSLLAGQSPEKTQTRNLVIRLAESAPDWARRDVHPTLGAWCEGYVTFRGAWCEPLGIELVQRLNARLHDMHTRVHAAAQQPAPVVERTS